MSMTPGQMFEHAADSALCKQGNEQTRWESATEDAADYYQDDIDELRARLDDEMCELDGRRLWHEAIALQDDYKWYVENSYGGGLDPADCESAEIADILSSLSNLFGFSRGKVSKKGLK